MKLNKSMIGKNRSTFGAIVAICAIGLSALSFFQRHDALQKIEGTPFKAVWLVSDPDADDIKVQLIFDRGEMDNPFAEGMAHYVEHLAWLNAFEGEQSSRHSNAWTTISATGYWQTAKPDNFAETVDRLLKVVQPLQLDNDFMLEERKIIQREYDLRVSEYPMYPVHREIDSAIYKDGPLSRSVIGDYREIGSFSLNDARSLHARTHLIGNGSLFITGNISATEVEAAIQVTPTSGTSISAAIAISDFEQMRDERTVEVPGLTSRQLIYRKIIEVDNCGDTPECSAALGAIHFSLDSTWEGGLAGPLRFDNFIAEHFSISFTKPDANHLEFGFYAKPDRGVSLDQLLDSFDVAFSETLRTGIPNSTFEKSKSRIVEDFELGENDLDYLSDHVVDLIRADWPIYDWDTALNAARQITKQDVDAILHQLAQPGRVVIRKAIPENE